MIPYRLTISIDSFTKINLIRSVSLHVDYDVRVAHVHVHVHTHTHTHAYVCLVGRYLELVLNY